MRAQNTQQAFELVDTLVERHAGNALVERAMNGLTHITNHAVVGDLKLGQSGRCGIPPWNIVVFFKNPSK